MSIGLFITQGHPYPLIVTFEILCQMTLFHEVSVIGSQFLSLYTGFGPQEIHCNHN